MKGEGALVAILTDESVESSNVATPSGALSHSSHFCSCIMVSPLSVNPLSEDVLPMFGREMIAAYHIRHVIEIVIRMMTEKSIVCVDYADIKQIIECGGILRIGVGMSTNGNAGDAAQKALESLALQGAF